jgi:hypothetical protein
MTAEEMDKCRWLKPRLVEMIEYLEWTAADQLLYARFSGLAANPRLKPRRALGPRRDG